MPSVATPKNNRQTKPAGRPSGFYWLRLKDEKEWNIGLWDEMGGFLLLCGEAYKYTVSEIAEWAGRITR